MEELVILEEAEVEPLGIPTLPAHGALHGPHMCFR